MELAKILVDGTVARVIARRPIPSGLKGGTIAVSYSPGIWDDLSKTVVFEGVVTKDVVTDEAVVEIPWETVAEPNKHLEVGFYGVDSAGTLIIPTVWCDLGRILSGADPSGDTTTDPTLPVWAQIKADVAAFGKSIPNSVEAALTEAKESGMFDGKDGKDGVPGEDYVLTDDDKEEIAQMAAALVEIPECSGGVDVSGAAPGDMIMVSAVDENGKPTAWTPIDLVGQGVSDVILPVTLFEDNGDNGVYYVSLMPYAIYFDPSENIVSGKTYAIVVDGKKYTATSEYREYDSSAGGDCVALETDDFTVLYTDNDFGMDNTGYYMGYFPKNPELDDEGLWLYEPMTIGILCDTKPEIKAKYMPSGYATEEWAEKVFQPKGEYLTAVPDGYAKTEDVPTDEKIIELVKDHTARADWSAAEGDPGYVANRTHWSNTGDTVAEEQTLITDDMEYSANVALEKSLEVGKEYSVTFEGINYNCIAKVYKDKVYLGNSGVSADCQMYFDEGWIDTGEPFCITQDEEFEILWANSEGTYTISIFENEIHKLPSQYLDMDAIKATFPTVEMVATLEDGTTATFKLYGEKVTV